MNFVCAPKKHNGFNYCDFREKNMTVTYKVKI